MNEKVALGDSFTRVGASRTVYTVDSFVDRPGVPLHVRLVEPRKWPSPPLLMSVSALRDPRFFRRVLDQPTG